MRHSRTAALTLAVATGALAPAAHAATLTVKEKCAVSVDGNSPTVNVAGSGFDPNGVRLEEVGGNGGPVATPGGAFSVKLGLLGLFRGEQPVAVSAVDRNGVRASAQLRKAGLEATVSPKTNRARPRPRRKVRITLGGWLGRTVYAHFVPPFPATKSKRTVKIGKTRKPCGRLKTSRRRFFPFKAKPGGTWTVVFDTRKRNINFNQRYRVKNQDKYREISESVGF